MVTIQVKAHIPYCDTNEQGEKIFDLINRAFAGGQDVTLSFEGIEDTTTSFINSAFVQLLDRYSLQVIKSRLRIVRSTRQINSLIRDRMNFAATSVG